MEKIFRYILVSIIIGFLFYRCILKEEGETFGYGGTISIATITLSTIISFQIGKLI